MRGSLPYRLGIALTTFGLWAAARGDVPPLNAHPGTDTLQGKFVWADLFTGDLGAASRFYTQLFGWTTSRVQEPSAYKASDQERRAYEVLYFQGTPVAGIVQRAAGAHPHPARWIEYISVNNLGSAISAVADAGGRVLQPARRVPRRGEQAIVADPEGSLIGLIQSSSGDPMDRASAPGEWCWFELFAAKPQSAANFYRAVWGYAVGPDNRGTWEHHFLLRTGDRPRAGVSPLPDAPDAKPDWLGFVRVEDIDHAVNQVTQLGGTVDVPPNSPELRSRFAIATDPTGGTFGLVQFVPGSNGEAGAQSQ